MLPHPAATVILLRDPLEVLMVKRHQDLAFMGGFWVFPGGRVDAEDGSAEAAARRELAEETGIVLPEASELVPFARWITPLGLPKRFDTWFFLVHAEGALAASTAVVDGSEIVAARWLSPAEALADPGSLAFPTRTQLQLLARQPSATAALATARETPVVTVEPEIVRDGGSPRIVVPGAPAPE
ncbi:NUDIX hydrolase [Conexibacter sp. DBS9H8]|uniref:NUDIX hydrolase n=1 Tax=Conexibacter sp. DBS9H8 TaxID=2937801 RepID=UPI00200DACBD|nr:NUDIX hydrolase [Conexibacter sp. DBS9H8]